VLKAEKAKQLGQSMQPNSSVSIRQNVISNKTPFMLFAGPCQLESRDHGFMMAEGIKEICTELNIPFVFKASFDKANRTSASGKRGLGLDKSLEIFAEIKEQLDLPILTDIHDAAQCAPVAEVVDVLQIPAFLCRQTDLLLAAGETGKVIKIKKGQFLAPWDMRNVVNKVLSTGNQNILLTERGASFGYNTLVTDFRGLPIMAETGCPVVFDATHSVQKPGGQGTSSGGQREFVPVLARAAVAVGVGGLFIESHDDPDNAPSDGPNMIPLNELKALLQSLKAIDDVVKGA
jgi:2-dehydro-3-deoxyphosphooctonate aldolase (KDO 8-P synthase)